MKEEENITHVSQGPTVTFDFDDTLTETQWNNTLECFDYIGPNKIIMAKLRNHLREGDEVHIVTSRQGRELDDDVISLHGQPSISEFLTEHLTANDRRKIAGVHFTSGALKTNKLLELNSIRHYDDDICELKALEDVPYQITCIRVETLHGLE